MGAGYIAILERHERAMVFQRLSIAFYVIEIQDRSRAEPP